MAAWRVLAGVLSTVLDNFATAMNFFSLHDRGGTGRPSVGMDSIYQYQRTLLAGNRLLRDGRRQRTGHRYHQRSCPDEDGAHAHGLVLPQYRLEGSRGWRGIGLAILWLSHTLMGGAMYLMI